MVRLVRFRVNEARALKAKMFASGLLLTCFLEVKARYLYVIAFKK